jgi:putative ABC transport system permease protein
MLRAPARFAATVAGVALGVASVVATLAGSRAAVASFGEDALALAGRSRLELTRAGGMEEELLGRLAPFCDRFLIAPVIEERAQIAEQGTLLRVLGVDLLVDTGVRPRPGSDGDSRSLSALLTRDAALLPRELAEGLGLRRGAELELVVRGRRVSLEVAEIFDPPRLASAWRRVVVLDIGLAQELFGRAGRLDRIELMPRLELDLTAESAALAAALPPGVRIAGVTTRLDESRRAVSALEFNLTALSGISVLVGLVLVATTLATSVRRRRTQLGLLRSLGASRGQLAGAVLIEAAVIGALGGALGVVGGALGSRAALIGVRGSVASVVPDAIAGVPHLQPGWVLAGLVLGLLVSVVAALLPVREVLRTPPLQAMRAAGEPDVALRSGSARLACFAGLLVAAAALASLPPVNDRPLFALLSALALLATVPLITESAITLAARRRSRLRFGRGPVSWHVARTGLESDTRGVTWGAAAVGIAIALSVSMTTMIGSFRRTIIDWSHEALSADLSVRPLSGAGGLPVGRLDPRVTAATRELFGPEHVDPFHSAPARVDGQTIDLAGAELGIAARHSSLPFLEGGSAREAFSAVLEQGGAVANEPFARRFGLARGDRIRIETPSGTIERELRGIYASYSNPSGLVVLDRADFLAHYPDEGADSLAVFLPPEADVELERERLLAALGADYALEVLPAAALRAEVMAVFERTFAVTTALELVATLVAVIAVALVLLARVSERRMELGVLRVLGSSRSQVAGVVTAEAGLLGLTGAGSGLVVGLSVGWVLVRVVNLQSFGWTLRFLPPWLEIGQTLLLVIPATLLAGLVPAWRALRLAPATVLREDR